MNSPAITTRYRQRKSTHIRGHSKTTNYDTVSSLAGDRTQVVTVSMKIYRMPDRSVGYVCPERVFPPNKDIVLVARGNSEVVAKAMLRKNRKMQHPDFAAFRFPKISYSSPFATPSQCPRVMTSAKAKQGFQQLRGFWFPWFVYPTYSATTIIPYAS